MLPLLRDIMINYNIVTRVYLSDVLKYKSLISHLTSHKPCTTKTNQVIGSINRVIILSCLTNSLYE